MIYLNGRALPAAAWILAAVFAGSTPALDAHEYYASTFQLVHPWTPESPAGSREVVLSMKVVDIAADDRLVAASTPVASSVELRPGPTSAKSSEAFALHKEREASFDLKGDHLVLKDVQIDLKHGYQYPLELRFEKAGVVDAEFVVGNH